MKRNNFVESRNISYAESCDLPSPTASAAWKPELSPTLRTFCKLASKDLQEKKMSIFQLAKNKMLLLQSSVLSILPLKLILFLQPMSDLLFGLESPKIEAVECLRLNSHGLCTRPRTKTTLGCYNARPFF